MRINGKPKIGGNLEFLNFFNNLNWEISCQKYKNLHWIRTSNFDFSLVFEPRLIHRNENRRRTSENKTAKVVKKCTPKFFKNRLETAASKNEKSVQ